MDLDGLFWIALIVFYFVARALGGKSKRQHKSSQPTRQPRERAERPQDDDLDVALDEIRRALGFPDSKPDVPREKEPTATSTSDVAHEQDRGRERVTGNERQAASRQEATWERQAASRQEAARERQNARRQEAARRREQALREKQPVPGRTLGDVPDMPVRRRIQPSGRWPDSGVGDGSDRIDPKTRRDLRVAFPSEAPTKKKHTGVKRRLAARSSLREAFLIKEILDRPVSMRRR